jgi:hypothetical protein
LGCSCCPPADGGFNHGLPVSLNRPKSTKEAEPLERIHEVFGVDVSHMDDGNVADSLMGMHQGRQPPGAADERQT